MSDTTPSTSNFVATVLAAMGGLAIFLLILLVAYLPQKPEPLGDGVLTPEERKAALAELQAKHRQATTTYDWVDQTAGVVRIPVDTAMEITLQELRQRAR